MKRKTAWFIGLVLVSPLVAHASMSVKIAQVHGEVKVRRGVEEKWERAGVGMLLEEIDTIMALEGAEVVLDFGERATFRLGGNAILDIADLRVITERELFLLLMSEKIGKLKPREGKIPLRIGEVSAVRGGPFQKADSHATKSETPRWRMEANAAQALHEQNFLTNAALKFHRVKAAFPQRGDCGVVSYELAQTFEALKQSGKARDEYQSALEEMKAQNCEGNIAQARITQTQEALQRLK